MCFNLLVDFSVGSTIYLCVCGGATLRVRKIQRYLYVYGVTTMRILIRYFCLVSVVPRFDIYIRSTVGSKSCFLSLCMDYFYCIIVKQNNKNKYLT